MVRKRISENGGMWKWTETFTQLVVPGVTDEVSVEGAKNHTTSVTVASINTNVLLQVEGSVDGTNYFKLPLEDVVVSGLAITSNVATITANGTYLLYVKDVTIKNIRTNFVSESGGTAATIDVLYLGGN